MVVSSPYHTSIEWREYLVSLLCLIICFPLLVYCCFLLAIITKTMLFLLYIKIYHLYLSIDYHMQKTTKKIPYKDNSLNNPQFKAYSEKLKQRGDDIRMIKFHKEHIMYFYITDYKDPSDADRVICKIGYSQNVTGRKKELESIYKCKFYLIGIKKIKGQIEEREFHQLLKAFYPDLYPCIKRHGKELTELYILDKRIIEEFDLMEEYNHKSPVSNEVNKTKCIEEKVIYVNTTIDSTNIEQEPIIKMDHDAKNLIEDDDKIDFENLFKCTVGLSKVFNGNMSDRIKIINCKAGDGYYFNGCTLLWEEKHSCFFSKLVMTTLDIIISEQISILAKKNNKSDIDVKNQTALEKILRSVYKIDFCEKVFRTAKNELVDNEFKSKLNRAPNMLPIKGGKILNLENLQVKNRSINDLFDFEIPFDFDINANLNNASKFFNQIMKGNTENVDYLQMCLGYCITGEINQRCIYIFWGKGSNGKTTLCDLLNKILGKFCVSVDKQIFITGKKGSSHTEYLMPLIGARVAIYAETEEGDSLNEALIKSLTGGDVISARAIFGKQFSFKPTSKYIMLTNEKPNFNINSKAMLDRLKYIPFSAFFDDKFTCDNPNLGQYKRDIEFIDKLSTINLHEVFMWLCIGANKYYNLISAGKIMIVPKNLEEARDEYINELDSAVGFIDDMCIKGDKLSVNRSELYQAYSNWFKKDSVGKLFKNSDFYKRMDKLGYISVKSNGVNKYKGLAIKKELVEYVDASQTV
jgi:P4 family phage/plasmid primase-like protien